MKRTAWFTTLVLATLALLLLLWQFREALGLFILSLGVAAATRPLADRIEGWRLPRGLSLVIVYIVLFGAVAGIVILISGKVVSEVELLSNHFVFFYDKLWRTWPAGTSLQRSMIQYLPQPKELYQGLAGEQGGAFFQSFLGATLSSLTMVSQFFAVLVLSIYWSIDQVHFERLWISLLPPERRVQARGIWRDIETGVGSYIRSEVGQSILASILLGAGYALLGIDYPVLLALFGAVAWLIPWLGAVLAVLPVIWVGLQTSPSLAIVAVVFTLLVLLFLELGVEPRLYSRRQYSSLLALVFMIALADVAGLVGLILAPPLAAAVQIFYTRLVVITIVQPVQNQASGIRDLEERLTRARETAASQGKEVTPQTASLIERLEKLIEKAGEELSGSQAERR